MVDLEDIWNTYTYNIGMDDNERSTWFKKIIERYNEESRKYYNLGQLKSRLQHFENIKHLIRNKMAFVVAIFFQYYDYDAKSEVCGKGSLEEFRQFAHDIRLEDAKLRSDIMKLLDLTDSNITPEHLNVGTYGNEDKHYFLDTDVAILGSTTEDYNAYAKAVQEEYNNIANRDYKKLRLKVLQNFLKIPNIYCTKEFRNKYENIAKANIEKEIESLR